jgi:hypothetical protein
MNLRQWPLKLLFWFEAFLDFVEFIYKMDILDAVEISKQRHNVICPGEVNICLGKAVEFDLSNSGEVDVLVQNGEVFHLLHCPKVAHEVVIAEIFVAVNDALRDSLGAFVRRNLVWAGTTDALVQNKQGCHAWQAKQPDNQLWVDPRYFKGRKFPILVFEVASQHEDLHMLLCEGSMWLNADTDVNMAFLVKIWPLKKQLELFLVKRNNIPFQGQRNVECVSPGLRKLRSMSDEMLGDYYNFSILIHKVISREGEELIELDLSILFEGIPMNLTDADPTITIDLSMLYTKYTADL